MSLGLLIERFWYSSTPMRWLLFLPSLIFLALTRIKRFGYLNGWFQVNQFEIPVVVVGNITVGGTGKTPFITYLAELLASEGLNVGVVSRGYHSQAPVYPHIVSAEDGVCTIGDEAYMQFCRLGIPMAIDANRSRAVEALCKNYNLDLIISDDGLQHYAMSRKLEIIMIDGIRGLGNGLMLPFGPLREDLKRLRSADILIQNGGEHFCNSLATEQLGGKTTKTIMILKPCTFVSLLSGEEISLDRFSDRKVKAICGIGNPQRFFNTLSELCEIIETRVFGDHHDFKEKDLEEFAADCVVMTEKDAVKCRKFAAKDWYFLKVDVSIRAEESQALLTKLKQKLAV